VPNYDKQAWLIGFINTDTLTIDKAMICSTYPVAQMGTAHQVVLEIGFGYSFEEGKLELERRLQRSELSWLWPVLR
jgi:hypothetical protein